MLPATRPRPVVAAVVDRTVVLEAEGRTVQLHPHWLRERSRCAGAVDLDNGQRLFEPVDLPLALGVAAASIDPDGRLAIEFGDGHRASYVVDELLQTNSMDPPAPAAWTASTGMVRSFDHRLLCDPRSAELGNALRTFFELGFFVITNGPTEPDALHEIVAPFGRITPTNFGVLFDVRTEPHAVDLAYTAVALAAHTDQPYRAPTPGIQFLHTILNDAPGGSSTVVDGFAAIDRLAAIDPDAHAVLCELDIEFRYDIGTDVKVHRAPIIERDARGRLRQFRFSPRLDFAPLADTQTLDRYYRGRRLLAEMLDDPAHRLRYRLQAGETLVVDNHRVLHGREAFDPTQGRRHLQGCYIDHDGPRTAWILEQRRLEDART